MTSFYGNGIGFNLPIEEVDGSQDDPVIFENLSPGEYLVKGAYKYTEENEFFYNSPFLHVDVTKDENTEQKVVTFEKFINEAWNKYILIFEGDGNYILHTYTFNRDNSTGIVYVSLKALPQPGQEETLYVTEKAVYKYANGQYVNLSSPSWEEMEK